MDKRIVIIGAVAGLLFGTGLLLSGMVRPEVVLAFLDIAGDWNPSLAFVMAGAVPVAWVGFVLAGRRGRPLWDSRLHFPDRSDIDARLIAGAALFGIGWGLAGICPAPALTLLVRAPLAGATFLVFLAAGLLLAPRLQLPRR